MVSTVVRLALNNTNTLIKKKIMKSNCQPSRVPLYLSDFFLLLCHSRSAELTKCTKSGIALSTSSFACADILYSWPDHVWGLDLKKKKQVLNDVCNYAYKPRQIKDEKKMHCFAVWVAPTPWVMQMQRQWFWVQVCLGGVFLSYGVTIRPRDVPKSQSVGMSLCGARMKL